MRRRSLLRLLPGLLPGMSALPAAAAGAFVAQRLLLDAVTPMLGLALVPLAQQLLALCQGFLQLRLEHGLGLLITLALLCPIDFGITGQRCWCHGRITAAQHTRALNDGHMAGAQGFAIARRVRLVGVFIATTVNTHRLLRAGTGRQHATCDTHTPQ